MPRWQVLLAVIVPCAVAVVMYLVDLLVRDTSSVLVASIVRFWLLLSLAVAAAPTGTLMLMLCLRLTLRASGARKHVVRSTHWPSSVTKQQSHASDSTCSLIVGFFHPYCSLTASFVTPGSFANPGTWIFSNDGGGGEKVLWAAVAAVQTRYPDARCIIYTGFGPEDGVTPSDCGSYRRFAQNVIDNARNRFNVTLPRPVELAFLSTRHWVEASGYPMFTLIGQSLGSLVLGYEALTLATPDIMIDTMGYAFNYPLWWLAGPCRVACYTHFPTISSDMLQLVWDRRQTYNNSSVVSSNPLLSRLKLVYYLAFASCYGFCGSCAAAVAANSSWTAGHLRALWHLEPALVFPPCDTAALQQIALQPRDPTMLISIAQFRPEKDHAMQLYSLAKLFEQYPQHRADGVRLVMIGAVRHEDDQERVDALQDLVRQLDIADHVEFKINVPYAERNSYFRDAVIGLHTMWNEHFGIGVVEMMAAGVVPVAHASGGPAMDIVEHADPLSAQSCGALAATPEQYARCIHLLLSSDDLRLAVQRNGRVSAARFSETLFADSFLAFIRPVVKACRR